MKFFGRQNEIKELQEIRNLSLQTARFTIVTGRRRSGKTSLLIKAYEDVLDMLYFFVARKSERQMKIETSRKFLDCTIIAYLFLRNGYNYCLANVLGKWKSHSRMAQPSEKFR